MLYISLIFILSGLLLFAFSVISGSLREESGEVPEKRKTTGEKSPASLSDTTSGRKAMVSVSADTKTESWKDVSRQPAREVKEVFLEKNETVIDDTIPEVFSGDGDGSPDAGESHDDDRNLHGDGEMAVLFNDQSSIVDYQHQKGTIDPGLVEYRNIKRVGRGRFLVEKEGINFKIDTRLYRYDFYKLDGMYTGDNYIALKIKGSEDKKLFLFEDGKRVIPGIKDSYEMFLSRI